jgi:hypothetical protein
LLGFIWFKASLFPFHFKQYPKGLGSTVSDLDIQHAALKLEKTKFTMFDDQVRDFLARKSIKTVILFGVEVKTTYLNI